MGTSIYSLQQQADLVSAFSLIFGLDLATHKFRACVFSFGSPTNPMKQHTLRTEGPVKVLGVHLDLDLSGKSQLEITRMRLKKGTAAL